MSCIIAAEPLPAVEATASVDQTQAQTIAAIHSKSKTPLIQATKCQKSWVISPTKHANINKIRAVADERLSRLEQEGIEDFSWVSDFKHQCVQDICCDLGITSGSVISATASPKIRIALPGGGGAVGASIAIEAGEKEAWKQDNRSKLGAAKTDERQLEWFI